MSFFFQEREAHDERPPAQEQPSDDKDNGLVVVYGSTFTYNEELPEEMTTKFGGKVAMEVAKLQKKIMEESDDVIAEQLAVETREEAPKEKEEEVKPPKPAFSKHDMKRAQILLGSILNATTVEAARKQMRMFSHSLDEYKQSPNSSNSSAVSVSPYIQAVLAAGGTVSMVIALEKWYTKSEECSLLAMGGLATLVVADPSSAYTVASVGGISTLSKVVQEHPKSQMVSSDAIEVLCSLAAQAITRPLVASEECRQLVQTAMAQFPMEEDIQLEGCEYFLEIGKLDGIKEDLVREKKLGKLLGQALDHFRDDVSVRAIQWYSS